MKTLVTGLHGFTGKYIFNELQAHGYDVSGLGCDLTDAKAVSERIEKLSPEAVMHLAGISFVGHSNANAFYDVNLIGTRNLLDAIKNFAPNIKSVLLASSANVYGNSSEGILSESLPPKPCNDYAVSKLAMEHMAMLWADKLPLFITRPFNYTGVGQAESFLIPKIVSHFIRKKPVIELGNIDVYREFGDVRRVSSIYRQLLECKPIGQTINVCTGHSCSLKQVLSLCEKITDHQIDIKINSNFIRPNEVRILTGDDTVLRQMVPSIDDISLEETLRWMLSSDCAG